MDNDSCCDEGLEMQCSSTCEITPLAHIITYSSLAWEVEVQTGPCRHGLNPSFDIYIYTHTHQGYEPFYLFSGVCKKQSIKDMNWNIARLKSKCALVQLWYSKLINYVFWNNIFYAKVVR